MNQLQKDIRTALSWKAWLPYEKHSHQDQQAFNRLECYVRKDVDDYCADLIRGLQEDIEVLQQRNAEFGDRINQLQRENVTIRNTIHDAMESERTHIGHNVLKQLYDSLFE